MITNCSINNKLYIVLEDKEDYLTWVKNINRDNHYAPMSYPAVAYYDGTMDNGMIILDYLYPCDLITLANLLGLKVTNDDYY